MKQLREMSIGKLAANNNMSFHKISHITNITDLTILPDFTLRK